MKNYVETRAQIYRFVVENALTRNEAHAAVSRIIADVYEETLGNDRDQVYRATDTGA